MIKQETFHTDIHHNSTGIRIPTTMFRNGTSIRRVAQMWFWTDGHLQTWSDDGVWADEVTSQCVVLSVLLISVVLILGDGCVFSPTVEVGKMICNEALL